MNVGHSPAKRESRHTPAPGIRINDDKRINSLRLTCPYCGSFARVRTSEYISEALITGLVECTKPSCGWRGHFDFTITETTSMCQLPGAEDVKIGIRLSPWAEKKLNEKAERTGMKDLYHDTEAAPTTLH